MEPIIQIEGIPLPLPDSVEERTFLAGSLLMLTYEDDPITDFEEVTVALSVAYSVLIANKDGGVTCTEEEFVEGLKSWVKTEDATIFIETLISLNVIDAESEELNGQLWGLSQKT